jgi:hypothetical protein
MGTIALEDIRFSEAVRTEWEDAALWDKLLQRLPIVNPDKV